MVGLWRPLGACLLLWGLCCPSTASTSLPAVGLSMPASADAQNLALLEPWQGGYFGVTMNNTVPLKQYVEEIGFDPVVFSTFQHFPLRDADVALLHDFLKQVAAVGGIALVTLEPHSGLAAVTAKACRRLVDILVPYETGGVSFMIRFGQEMNGGWYPWCQRPTEYVAAFRLLAAHIRAFTCRSAMLWAPNNGGGYPFSYGAHTCKGAEDCSDFGVLDTNGDGQLSMEDDMYSPFYPGDDAVDWVGMTLYHWGRKSPWGRNEVPEPSSFYDKLTGNYDGANGNESAVPDFYAMFCANASRNKPLALPEVAALYNPTSSCCDDELAVKQAWWRQILNVEGDSEEARDVSKWLPRLKMVVWFDNRKKEGGFNVDWTFSSNATVLQALVRDLQVVQRKKGQRYWKLLHDFQQDESLVDLSPAPTDIVIITNGSITVSVGVPFQGHISQVGVEVYSVDNSGMPATKMGAGATVVRGHRRSWSVDVDVVFKEPQDPSWQQGILYYSASVRALDGVPSHNRSDECPVRSPLRAVRARRGGTRPPAPLHPSLLLIPFGRVTLLAFLLALAAFMLYIAVRRRLLARGTLGDVYSGAFRYAAVQGNIEVMEQISRMKGFDVDRTSILGFSALHAAVIAGQVEAVEWLLERGACVEQRKQDKWEDSALHYAAANGHAHAAYLLLAHGAHPGRRNFQGATAADLALDAGHMDLASDLYKLARKWEGGDGSPSTLVSIKVEQQQQQQQQQGGSSSTLMRLMAQEHLELLKKSASDKMKRSWSPVSVLDNSLLHSSGVSSDYSALDSPCSVSSSGSGSGSASAEREDEQQQQQQQQRLVERAYYGAGTPGAQLKRGTYWWRLLAIITQALGVVYFVWRAERSLNKDCIAVSIVFYLCELATFAPSFFFCLEIWAPVERAQRSLQAMGLAAAAYPGVDAYVVCYNEPVAIIEATVCAALNMIYPPSKLVVHVLDDGRREEVETMCAKLKAEMEQQPAGPYGRGWPSLHYATRTKVKGVPHHAKAGNINSQLLKGRATWQAVPGSHVVVFDCDMIPKPEFLDRVMGHFYEQSPRGGGWRARPKLAFVQTPQDFYNVEKDDPMGHRAAFFYGPMMQGRDGIGACPCVGTGVIFRRDALVSIGGQAFGSITEDYNSAMALMSAGFSSIYLNERLIFGLAPDDIDSVLKQRLRWAMGSLQILCRDNPLLKPALTAPQALLFFQSAFQYCLALPTLIISLAPIVYLWTSVGPLSANAQEFCTLFALYYGANRVMLWSAHRGVPNKGHEMWRGSQAWVWAVPNNLLACWKVLASELWLFRVLLGAREIGFTVTKKDADNNWRHALRQTWMYLVYYLLIALGCLYNVVRFAMGLLSQEEALAQAVALAWGVLICMYLWPPLSMALPWHKPGTPGSVLWDDTIPELPQQGAVPGLTDSGGQALQPLHFWQWLSTRLQGQQTTTSTLSSALTQPLLADPKAPRALREQHSLSAGRPHFSLMRRVRDSFTFVFVNGVTLTGILAAGALYALFATPPLRAVLHTYVAPRASAYLQQAQALVMASLQL